MLQSYILYIYLQTQENGKKIVTEYTHTVGVFFNHSIQSIKKQTNKQLSEVKTHQRADHRVDRTPAGVHVPPDKGTARQQHRTPHATSMQLLAIQLIFILIVVVGHISLNRRTQSRQLQPGVRPRSGSWFFSCARTRLSKAGSAGYFAQPVLASPLMQAKPGKCCECSQSEFLRGPRGEYMSPEVAQRDECIGGLLQQVFAGGTSGHRGATGA